MICHQQQMQERFVLTSIFFPCGVWCHWLTTCLLYVRPPFFHVVLNNSRSINNTELLIDQSLVTVLLWWPNRKYYQKPCVFIQPLEYEGREKLQRNPRGSFIKFVSWFWSNENKLRTQENSHMTKLILVYFVSVNSENKLFTWYVLW